MINDKKLCVVVPFRDRYAHLEPFLDSIIPMLESQGIKYEIVIVEQTFTKQFNRGMVKNIGYLEVDADYYCFHDIDMLPETSDYSYMEFPTHLAVEVEQFGWKLVYDAFFGGVVLFTKQDFLLIQGYCNEYWGWGAEDDDLRLRCDKKNLKLMRKPGRYRSLNHMRPIIEEEYQKNLDILRKVQTDNSIEFNDLDTCKYEINSEEILRENVKKITVEI